MRYWPLWLCVLAMLGPHDPGFSSIYRDMGSALRGELKGLLKRLRE